MCGVRPGTVTMNCSKHATRKRYCTECLDLLANKTHCVEIDCNAQINFVKVTRRFQPWKLESWDFYKERLVFAFTALGIAIIFFMAMLVALCSMAAGFASLENAGWTLSDHALVAMYLLISSALILFLYAFCILFEFDKSMASEFQQLVQFNRKYYMLYVLSAYLLICIIICSLAGQSTFFSKLSVACLLFFYSGMQGFYLYNFRTNIWKKTKQWFIDSHKAVLDFVMEEKIETFYLERDDPPSAV
jgi:hypothetical protein